MKGFQVGYDMAAPGALDNKIEDMLQEVNRGRVAGVNYATRIGKSSFYSLQVSVYVQSSLQANLKTRG